jgi:predicted RNase H-like nuclease
MNEARVRIVGVDCAVENRKVGIAVAVCGTGNLRLMRPQSANDFKVEDCAAEVVKLMASDDPVLLALDAPLGWPVDLSPPLKTTGLANG